MAVNLSPLGGVAAQFFNNDGVPLAGGLIYTYLAGTNTPASTYTTGAGNVAHSNPIVLDSAGRVPTGEIWLTDSVSYKFVIKDVNLALIGTYDNIVGINSNFVNYTSSQEIQTATAGQTLFTLTTMVYQPGTNSLSVFVDGVNQYGPGAQYAFLETSGTSVTFVSGLHVGASVKFTTSQINSASYGDASQISYTPAGAGAVTRSVQTKLRETLISRNDYTTTGNFNNAVAANPTIPSLDGSGNFNAKVTPTGENAQISLSDAVLTIATSNRAAVRYNTSTAVSISCPRHILMGGFRFFGQYTKARVPVFSRASGSQQTVSLTTDLGAESIAHLDGWYAVFACADNGDATPSFKVMPFLRAGTVAGSQITFCSAAEGIHSNTATTYAWSSTNNLAGVECLVINETVDGRANAFSGRTTTITANTTTTITLANIGAITTFDWILPAPPGFDNYCYMGSFYYESPGDVRNIGDTGSLVKAKMINTSDPNWSATGQVGSIASPVAIRFGGYVCPLATGVVVKDTASFSTSATGTYAAYFDIDGSQHIVQTAFSTKEAAATETELIDGITVPFCFSQTFYYSNAGSIIALRSGGTLEITGWIEV
jgi:hypothetical protein